MKLSLLIPESQIVLLPSQESSVPKILEQLLDHLWNHSILKHESSSREDLLEALINREAAHPTAIGEGVAFPHARILGLEGTYHLIAVSREGLDFDSIDGEKVHVFFLSFVSRETPAPLLRSRAAFTRWLATMGGAEGLKKLDTSEALWQALDASDMRIDQEITARDLMRPIGPTLSATANLRDAARKLHLHHTDTMPIIDQEGRFLGQLSCHELFSFGLPDFFRQLHTISFIRHMNPFEKYFQCDRSVTVQEAVKDNKKKRISADATLMEVVFEMSVHNNEVLYVTNQDDTLLGLIDRFSIVDRILVSSVQKEEV